MSWVYEVSEPGLLTVGFYDPNGRWHAHADFSSRDEAADEVARLNGGSGHGRRQLAVDQENLRLQSKLEEEQLKWENHDCSSFLEKPVDVMVSPDDPRFGDDPPEVLLRVQSYFERGDDSVGIPDTSMIVLSEDQRGTWLERVVESRVTNAHHELHLEFVMWRRHNGIAFDGSAEELLAEFVHGKVRRDPTDGPTCSADEAIRWLRDFLSRWDSAGWVLP